MQFCMLKGSPVRDVCGAIIRLKHFITFYVNYQSKEK